jgi:hypothetical protein
MAHTRQDECGGARKRPISDETLEALAHCEGYEEIARDLKATLQVCCPHPKTLAQLCRTMASVIWGWSPDEIARHINVPMRYVSEAIAMVNAPLEARQMIDAGEVTPARVLDAIRKHGDRAPLHLRHALNGYQTKPRRHRKK